MIRKTPHLVHAAQLTALVLVALIAFAGAGSTGAATAPAGLVAAYSFDAGTGTTLADSSGLANTGTISGATWTTGKNGGALNFDGADDSVRINDANSLDLSTGMTLEAWVRPRTSDSTWRTVVTKETTGNLTYGLFSNSDTARPAGISTIGNQYIQSITRGSTGMPRSTWRHLATTYDGASLRLYIDAALVSSTPVSGAMANSSGPLKIGGNAIWQEWFSGRIDDLRVYNRALSASELQTDMNTPVTGTTAPPADTQAPTAPSALRASDQTQTTITFSWNASTDNTGVAGYRSFRNGIQAGSDSATSYTFSGLACGTTYTLGVEAYDAAGNTSSRPTMTVATSPCPPAGDTQAPTAPTGLVASGQTQTAITLGWNASTDNTGVTGYRSFRNGALIGTGNARSYTFGSLACGTTYTLAVEAYDAAGNTSSRPSTTASTTACSAPPPPPPPPPPPTSGTANLWVDTSGGSCVRQSSPGAYSDAQACSWSAAYQAAQSGDLILVKGGSYGNVTMGANKPSTSNVTYRTANGENVVLNDFENGHIAGASGVSNITLVGPVTAQTFRSDKASNVVVDNWRVDCGGCANVQIFHIESASNVVVRNSDISDNTDAPLIWINGSNLTFENNVIHDAGLRAGSGAHTECMYVWSVSGLTLKRNHFYHCSVMDVFITGNSVSDGGYVENNVFEKPWSSTGQVGNGLAFHFRNGGDPSPDPNNWDFRHNTFVGPLSISSESPVGSGGMRVIGNVFLSSAPCGKGNTTYSHNAFVSGACGTNAITNPLSTYQAGFTNAGDPGDYSLRSTSVLRDKGSMSSYPSNDRAGGGRYSGSAPDIGAYEYAG